MITGDHKITAAAIAKMLGIGDGKTAITGGEIEDMDTATLQERVRDVDVFARASHPDIWSAAEGGDRGGSRRVMLFVATDEMHRGAPGVPRQRLQAAQRIDAHDRRVGTQRSAGDRAQGRASVRLLQLRQLCGAALKLGESLIGR